MKFIAAVFVSLSLAGCQTPQPVVVIPPSQPLSQEQSQQILNQIYQQQQMQYMQRAQMLQSFNTAVQFGQSISAPIQNLAVPRNQQSTCFFSGNMMRCY